MIVPTWYEVAFSWHHIKNPDPKKGWKKEDFFQNKKNINLIHRITSGIFLLITCVYQGRYLYRMAKEKIGLIRRDEIEESYQRQKYPYLSVVGHDASACSVIAGFLSEKEVARANLVSRSGLFCQSSKLFVRRLNRNECNLKDIGCDSIQKAIEFLKKHGTAIRRVDLSCFGTEVEDTHISQIAQHCPNITTLNLSNCNYLTITMIEFLNLPSLEKVYGPNNKIFQLDIEIRLLSIPNCNLFLTDKKREKYIKNLPWLRGYIKYSRACKRAEADSQ